MIEIPPHIKELSPYVPGKPLEELKREKGLTKIVKLASNENPLGPSPKAIEAIKKHLSGCHIYPDATAHQLTRTLAKKLNRLPDQIICTYGVDALLGYLVIAFSQRGDELLTSEGTFIGAYVNTKKNSRTLSRVPLKNYQYDVPKLLSRISKKTKIIYFANPNNPTGATLTHVDLELIQKSVRKDILIILDEAYYSFTSGRSHFPNGMDYEADNLIVTRTFSKDYGLAGLRIGYAVGPKRLIAELYKVKLPFEPGLLAQRAAIAALEDHDYLKKSVELALASLARMMKLFDTLGIRYVRPSANYIMLIMPTETFAKNFHQACLDRGLILRHLTPFGIPEGIRISAGTEAETGFALEVIEKTYKELI